MEPTGGLSWYRSYLCAVLLEVVCVSGYLLDPGTYLFAVGSAGEKETRLVGSILSWSVSFSGSQALAWLDCQPVGILKSHCSF